MQIQSSRNAKKKIIPINRNDTLVCIYENITKWEGSFIDLLHDITTIDFNGRYVVNITFTELEQFKMLKLDIFRKYKQYLREVEAFQDRKAQLQQLMNNK